MPTYTCPLNKVFFWRLFEGIRSTDDKKSGNISHACCLPERLAQRNVGHTTASAHQLHLDTDSADVIINRGENLP